MTDKAKLAEQLRADLTDIPDLYQRAWLFLAGCRSGDLSPIGGPSDSRPPIDLAVLDLLDEREKRDAPVTRLYEATNRGGGAEHDSRAWTWKDGADRDVREPARRRQGVLPTLSSWVRDVDSARWDDGDEHQNPPTQRTVPGECGWLTESLDWIAEQPWMPEMAADIRSIRDDLRAVTRDHDIRERLTCTSCGWPVVESPAVNGYRCTGCDAVTTRIELHRRAERKRPRPIAECARVLDVPHRTLRHLRDSGQLRHVARDGNANLYDLADCAAAIARHKIARQLAEATR